MSATARGREGRSHKLVILKKKTVEPLNKDTFRTSRLSFVERLSSFRGDFI